MIDPQKKYRLGTVSKNILLEGLNRAPTSPLVQMWIKSHRYLVCMRPLTYLEHINQDIKGDKAMIRTRQLIKLNAGAKEIQQVNPGGPGNNH